MKSLVITTTGQMAGKIHHCGDFGGEFANEAYDIISEREELPEFEGNQWADIMYDNEGRVYAVWAEDALTCWSDKLIYLELEESDCPRAFEKMREKLDY